MIKHYLTIAYRSLLRQRGYSLINVLGLATGMAACLLIMLYIRFEASYDQFHQDSDRLYRVIQKNQDGYWSFSGVPMGPQLKADFPVLEQQVRLHRRSTLISNEQAPSPLRFREENMLFVDSTFFDLFAFKLLKGDPHRLLRQPNDLILTTSMVARYFKPDEDPMGKVLRIDGKHDMVVRGVLEDVPENSHIQFDVLASFSMLYQVYQTREFSSWWWPAVDTYVKARPGMDLNAMNEEALPAFVQRYREPGVARKIIPQLQAVEGIHLYAEPIGDGVIEYLYVFGAIAFFVLLIACVNFMNLATARAATRALEVGIRKVVGAHRAQLITQFFSESFLLTLVAALASVGLVELLLPFFNDLTGTHLQLGYRDVQFWSMLSGITLAVAFLAGSYPALFLSRFRPMSVLNMQVQFRMGRNRLRQALVVFQFSLSVILMACTMIVHQQHAYMQEKNMGFARETLLAIPLKGERSQESYEAFKHALRQGPAVASVSASNWLPGLGNYAIYPAEVGNSSEYMKDFSPGVIYVDEDFLASSGIDVARGRGFDPTLEADRDKAFLLNQVAVEALGLENPLGEPTRVSFGEFGKTMYEKEGEVIGVVEDFHITPVQEAIGPVLLTLANTNERYLLTNYLVRVHGGQVRQALDYIEMIWPEYFPNQPLETVFPDEAIMPAYAREQRLGRIVTAFAVLAVLIACLGLLGLAAFAAIQRTKEIGIRKILGASVTHIVVMLSQEFARLIWLAILIGIPIAYVVMDQWLSTYPYHMDHGMFPYLVAALLALLVTFLTVSFHAFRAASGQPVEAIRHE